uniref:Uncharacterized protein n=1 Tax=Arion vulgaris TaxID=1028688 RepID=A0A0B7ALI3_9EUPU
MGQAEGAIQQVCSPKNINLGRERVTIPVDANTTFLTRITVDGSGENKFQWWRILRSKHKYIKTQETVIL